MILTAHGTGTLNLFFRAFQSATEKQKLYRCINHSPYVRYYGLYWENRDKKMSNPNPLTSVC